MNPINKVAAVNYLLENSLDFRVKVSADELKEILSKFKVYNFIPNTICNIGDVVKKVIGPTKFKGENPNNGHFDNIDFFIGNESSLVIYVVVKPMYQVGADKQVIKTQLAIIGDNFEAQENNLHEEDTFITWRYWFD